MLTIGMTTECIIFFLSAFDPVDKKYKWENIFPELLDAELDAELMPERTAAAVGRVSAGTAAIPQINLDVSKEQTDRLKVGIDRLGSTIDQLGGLAAVAEASARLTENLDKANNSVGLASASANTLADSYKNSAATISQINEQTKKDMDVMVANQASYNKQVDVLSKSMAATNASFELQLQENEAYRKSYQSLNNEIGTLVADVKKSVSQTQALTASMESLSSNVSQLNTVYGSMLNAVTSVLNK